MTAAPTHAGMKRPDARGLVLVGFLIVVAATFSILQPAFISESAVRGLTLDVSLALVLALGQFLVVVTRNLDLSVGSIVGIAAMAAGAFGRSNPAATPVAVAAVALLVGLGAGAFNGIFVAYFRLPSIIFTLGMLSVYRGAVYVIGGGYQVNPNDIPEAVVRLSTLTIGSWIPVIFALAMAVLVAVLLITGQTRFGRSLFAIGSNPEAAVLRGLPARQVTALAFAVNGALAGLVGFMFLSRYGFVQNLTGSGLELLAVAAVVIGGVSVFGGSGSAVGVALGVLLIGVLTNGFAVIGLSIFWRDAAYGLLILLAVSADAVARRRVHRRKRVAT